MAGANRTAAGAGEQLPAALDHIDALVVEEGSGDFLRAAHADVVAGVGAAAATAVRGQQVIPAIVIHHVGRFAVDGEVAWAVVRDRGACPSWDRVRPAGCSRNTSRRRARACRRWDPERRLGRWHCSLRRRLTRRPPRLLPTCSRANPDRGSCRRAIRLLTWAVCRVPNSRRSICHQIGSGPGPMCCCRRAQAHPSRAVRREVPASTYRPAAMSIRHRSWRSGDRCRCRSA